MVIAACCHGIDVVVCFRVVVFHVSDCSRNLVKWKMLAERGKKKVVFHALFIG